MTRRVFLSGATLVLPDRLASGQTLVVEAERIVDILSGPRQLGDAEQRVDLAGALVVPGFVDVHVHGIAGIDVLDGDGSVREVARRLPQWGVTAFCPTSVACPPGVLEPFLAEVAAMRSAPSDDGARVLPAHLESNFVNPEFRGAQPLACLRLPPSNGVTAAGSGDRSFSAEQIVEVCSQRRPDVGIVTLAPELPGGLDLVRQFAAWGARVSLGHSGASFEEAEAAIAAGARQATHLFNRMRPMSHRDPGLAGAVLASDEVAAELICDGHHVHPAVMRLAIRAKSPSRVMAISDGTAGSGLARGAAATLGGHRIRVEDVARLDDGTMAGSVTTMDRVFSTLVSACGVDVVRAAEMCATTPAREMGLVGFGVIAAGAAADFTVLDDDLRVVQTWISGRRRYHRQ